MLEAVATQSLSIPSNRPRLAIERSGAKTRNLPRNRAFIIGRSANCDLQLIDDCVSRRHCSIRFEGKSFWIEQLSRTNPTKIDGVQVDRACLQPGMWLEIGRHRLRFTSANSRCDESTFGYPESGGTLNPIGCSSFFEKTKRKLEKFAPVAMPILLRGETGTGKEVFAQAIHRRSRVSAGPFVVINCAAIPDNLAESELFGHIKGSFSGADRDHRGAFERAQGGTLFLDEVGELSLPLQAKLLRVLENGSFRAVGSEEEKCSDARVITATHRPLEDMIAEGSFREDLYHRLSVLSLELAPLRERKEDIPLLLNQFQRELEGTLGRPIRISNEARLAARKHSWPGNIRALRNALCRAAIQCEDEISATDLIPKAKSPSRLLREGIWIPRGDYASMNHALLSRIVAEQGSIRQAAHQLRVPRSTLGAWLRRTDHAK